MLLLLAQTIRLIPDATVIFQLIIFLAVVVILSVFVFRPTLKILDERRRRTSDLQKETDKLSTDAAAMDREYAEKIAVARTEGSALERELLNLGEDEARKIIGAAKQEGRQSISKTHDEIVSDTAKTKQDLTKQISDFAKMIVAKVLLRRP